MLALPDDSWSRTGPWRPVDIPAARRRMVDGLLARGAFRDLRVRDALLAVPREAFVVEGEAHADSPQPIGAGQTISAPHMVAIMAEALEVDPRHHVLEVGGGSGYHAAVLAHLARKVTSVEVVPELAARARDTLRRLGIRNVEVVLGDGSRGWPSGAPYDRISVAAGAPGIPPPLLEQLSEDGLLVLPVGAMDTQTLVRVDKRGNETPLGAVRFVPLLGAHGWPS